MVDLDLLVRNLRSTVYVSDLIIRYNKLNKKRKEVNAHAKKAALNC